MDLEKSSDELGVGVKGQSNPVIAGSPRNALRCSPGALTGGGRDTEWTRAPGGVLNPAKLRMPPGEARE